MKDLLKNMIQYIFDLTSGSTTDTSMLTKNLNDYLPALYTYATLVMDIVVKPIAYAILGFFCLMELKKIAEKIESTGGGNSMLGLKLIGMMGLKIGICTLVLANLSLVLRAILSIGIEITTQIAVLDLAGGNSSSMETTKMLAAIEDLGTIESIAAWSVIFIVWLVAIVAHYMTQIIFAMRFFELYVLYAVSPLPIATFPSDELGQIGKNFLKRFAAASLQGVLLFLIISFFPILMRAAISLNASDDLFMGLASLMMYSVALILCVFHAGQWAKSITTAT
ncbi:hypothetical protein BH739_04645 [Enterococcus casseliflavus]|nr:hypothetical protein BH739_04645 [Enterococcus casseliflavus]